jgi:cysteine-rich repeat protein
MTPIRIIVIASTVPLFLASCNPPECPADMDAGSSTTDECTPQPPPPSLPQCNDNGLCEKNEDSCADCSLCGDRNMDPGELCDDGNTNNNDGCVDNCQPATCGDGHVRTEGTVAEKEVCDDGVNNVTSNAYDLHPHCLAAPTNANTMCKSLTPYCGDGGTCTNDDRMAGCLLDCGTSECGNKIVEPGEACDDGVETQTCNGPMSPGKNGDVECQRPICGDGWTNKAALEECDDANSENGDHCIACVEAFCKDGFVEVGVEQCDDKLQPDNCKDCVILRRVFITTTTFTADKILGLNGGDARCNADAESKGLPGRFRAWLSDSTGSPSSRFDTTFKGNYLRLDGILVAEGWDGLTTIGPMVPINIDVDGKMAGGSVWTNTKSDGTIDAAVNHCTNWTSLAGTSNIGDATQTGKLWTMADSGEGCNGGARLYCFEDR